MQNKPSRGKKDIKVDEYTGISSLSCGRRMGEAYYENAVDDGTRMSHDVSTMSISLYKDSRGNRGLE